MSVAPSRAPAELPQSAALFDRARRLTPGGVHSNSRWRRPHPIYMSRAEGASVWDADGVRYLDCTMGNGAVILGHADERVTAAVMGALSDGLTAGWEVRGTIEVVERLEEMVPNFGKARFANTGTEAVMHVIRIARAATGRDRVAKCEAAYHGWSDATWVSTWPAEDAMGSADAPSSAPGSAGLASVPTTLVLPFNDLAATERLLRANADELACVLIEPVLIDVGFVPSAVEYLAGVRALTERLGIVLVFDELLTGFRLAPGGARQKYGITPDLSLFGKALANGHPLALVEGREALLDLTDPSSAPAVGYVGTYNGYPLSVAAAAETLRIICEEEVLDYLESLTDRLRSGFAELSERHHVPVVLAGSGGHFQPYFIDQAPSSYRDLLKVDKLAYATLVDVLAQRSILIAPGPLLHSALSAAHSEENVDELLAGAEDAFKVIAEAQA